MGHSSIEQTASNYCHVLEIIAIDRIVNSNYMIHKDVIQKLLGTEPNKDEFNVINDVIKTPEFKWMCTRNTEIKVQKAVSALKVEKIQLNPLDRIMAVKDGYLEDEQAKVWLRRCNFLSKKWLDKKSLSLNYEQYNHDESELFFDELYDRCKKLKLMQSKEVLVSVKEEGITQALKKSLQVLMTEGKRRKNYLHFHLQKLRSKNRANSRAADKGINQFQDKNNKDFINGITKILKQNINLINEYKVEKESIQRISFIKKEENGSNTKYKNVTLVVLFHLMIIAVQLEELWENNIQNPI